LSIIRFTGLFCLAASAIYGQALGRSYGRSIVISQRGIAATSQVLASQAGAQILARGGSAVDAAIAEFRQNFFAGRQSSANRAVI
jgi:gamma-glutamyltranspeptidase / glutathione hydrolase